MAPITAQHHHRATTKTSQKSFKSKHASKSELRDKAKGTDLTVEQSTRLTTQANSRKPNAAPGKLPTSNSCRNSTGGTRLGRSSN